MTTGSVMRVQQALGQRSAHIAQVTLVALTHHDIVLRFVQVEHLARGKKSLGAELFVVVGVIEWLPSTVYAALGACHDFDKVVAAFAGGNPVEQHVRIFQAMNNGKPECRAINLDNCLTDPGLAANLDEIQFAERPATQFLDGEAQGRFGYTAGVAEYHAGTGGETERHVKGFR